MRLLVGLAAIVAIVAGGIYILRSWQDFSSLKESRVRESAARLELFDLAAAKPGETEKVQAFCRNLEKAPSNSALAQNEMYPQTLNNCRALGYL